MSEVLSTASTHLQGRHVHVPMTGDVISQCCNTILRTHPVWASASLPLLASLCRFGPVRISLQCGDLNSRSRSFTRSLSVRAVAQNFFVQYDYRQTCRRISSSLQHLALSYVRSRRLSLKMISVVISGPFFCFLLHNHIINKKKIFIRRCKIRSKFSLFFLAS